MDQGLLNAHGELAKVIPYSSIKQANKAVENVLTKQSAAAKRQAYQKISTELKTKIAKCTAENGIKAAVVKFKDKVPNPPNNWKNMVCDWKEAYVQELERKRKGGCMDEVMLPVKKKGRPLLIGDELDTQVQTYIKDLRRCQATVNKAIVISAAEGIVKGHDANLLSCNGGTLELTKDWAKRMMK